VARGEYRHRKRSRRLAANARHDAESNARSCGLEIEAEMANPPGEDRCEVSEAVAEGRVPDLPREAAPYATMDVAAETTVTRSRRSSGARGGRPCRLRPSRPPPRATDAERRMVSRAPGRRTPDSQAMRGGARTTCATAPLPTARTARSGRRSPAACRDGGQSDGYRWLVAGVSGGREDDGVTSSRGSAPDGGAAARQDPRAASGRR